MEQENVSPCFVNNNLQAVKESEEEQMAETFTKMNKKFSQPQQKEISKKNTPRNHAKLVENTTINPSQKKAYHPGKNYKLNEQTSGGNSVSTLLNGTSRTK